MKILFGLLLLGTSLVGNAQSFSSGDIVLLQHVIVCNKKEDSIKLLSMLQFGGEQGLQKLFTSIEKDRDESGEFRCSFIREATRFKIGERVHEASVPDLDNPRRRIVWYVISADSLVKSKMQYFLSIIPVGRKSAIPTYLEQET